MNITLSLHDRCASDRQPNQNNPVLDVRVTGPEFSLEENRMALLRIADVAEQFAAHSREILHLVRQPTSLGRDHFAVLWSRGIGLVAFYGESGSIRGSRRGAWLLESPAHVRSSFENPFETLQNASKELESLAERLGHDGALTTSLVAIFNGPVREIRVESGENGQPFASMTLDFALARNISHLPNLLRAMDQKSQALTNGEMEILAEAFERNAFEHSETNARHDRATQVSEVDHMSIRGAISGWQSRRLWAIPSIVLAAAIVYYLVRSLVHAPSVPKPETIQKAAQRSQAPGMIVIELPREVQLFVSPRMYQSRLELDRALEHGEGERFLPATEQIVIFDSLTLAKGVYGYFKVDNAWRKGKLLQTFQPADTIHIDNFLGPLP
ncbi:MAG: hypothetical protein Q8922_12200 [Bacteroidota bacterium]|nr:hypothetical protein [Bacteroidota bacterium]MDP4233723.1 hypothetical protein [Bacteroidota bacterium]MDP4242362.1 hypothetical protein [Bacteroidota bacterium]MDP4288685.1 hypothetical protein [Bacteroidota bacterium]